LFFGTDCTDCTDVDRKCSSESSTRFTAASSNGCEDSTFDLGAFTKVDKKADFDAGCLQVVGQLRFVRCMQFLHRLELQNLYLA
jgi:hypothetical protein